MPAFDFIPGQRYLKGLHGMALHLGMLGSSKPPVIPQPIIAPTENSAAVTAAQQKELAATAARSGRASTILTMNDISKTDTMGG